MSTIQSWGLDLLIDGVILLRLDGFEKPTSLPGVNSFGNMFLKTVLFVAHSPPDSNSDSYLAIIWAKRNEEGCPPFWHIECPLSSMDSLRFPGLVVTPWTSNVHPKFSKSDYPNIGIFPRGCPLKSNLETEPRGEQIPGLGACLQYKSFIWKSQGELIPGHTINFSREGFARLHLRTPEDVSIDNFLFSQNIQYWPHVEVFALERTTLPRPTERHLLDIPFTRDIGTEALNSDQPRNNFQINNQISVNQIQRGIPQEMIITEKEFSSSPASLDNNDGFLHQLIYGSGNIFLSMFRWIIYSIILKPRVF